MRLGLTATPQRSDGRHADLDWLIGPKVYEMPLSDAKGATLADYDVVRIPVHLEPDERARYDALSREVARLHVLTAEGKSPSIPGRTCAPSPERTLMPGRAQKAYFAKQPLKTGPMKSYGCWRISSGFMMGHGLLYS